MARQPLPSFPPLLAPTGWWRLFLKQLLYGDSEEQAIIVANRLSGIKSREWMRIRLHNDDDFLSIPVDGGASALKNHPPFSWTLARESIREVKKAESTLATLYGRSPFFSLTHSDIMQPLYGDHGRSAAQVCTEAFHKVCFLLGINEALLSSIIEVFEKKIPAPETLIRKCSNEFPPCCGITDAIFRLGPDAIFALIPAF